MKEKNNANTLQELREIREKLSEKYWNNSTLLKKEMGGIQQKYNLKQIELRLGIKAEK